MHIKVQAWDRTGQPIELTAEGYMAKCMQHEIDHLNGLLYLDRLSPLRRQQLLKKIYEVRREKTPRQKS